MPERSSSSFRVRDFGPCKVIILAGGLGTRLAERTDELPKPMVEIGGGRPILWHILKAYSQCGFNDFIIAAGYRSEVIKRFFFEYRRQTSDLVFDFSMPGGAVEYINTHVEPWRIAVIDTGIDTMTGGRLRRLRANLATEDGELRREGERDRGRVGDKPWPTAASPSPSRPLSQPPPLPLSRSPTLSPGSSTRASAPIMMTYGDGVADIDINALLAFHRAHGQLATFTAVQRPTQYGVPRLEGDRAVAFAEKPAAEGEWINAGFFVLESSVLERIAGDQESFELTTLPALAAEGELMAFKHRGFWQPMDTLRDVRTLNALWNEGRAPWKTW